MPGFVDFSNIFHISFSLQTLPRIPKLYTPSVACYPNDENFKFCQQCGYVRRFVRDHVQSPAKKCKIDEGYIAERLQQLSQQRSSSRYAKQKLALELELGQFLASLRTPKSLSFALPADIIAPLVWKDRGGKTKVRQSACPAVSQTGMSCAYPKRLAFGTVDSLIGKLRAIFVEHGRGSEWHSLLGVGNTWPAACRSIKTYLADVREEQLRARITPRQAEPIILSDLRVISGYLEKMLLNSSVLSAIQVFIYARDQALFKALCFAGDRAADLLQIKLSDILRFPDDSGFLFNHVWTKSLRSGEANVFAFKRGSNTSVCPVRGLEIYFNICKLLGIRLSPGFLFRSLTKSNLVGPHCLESATAQARLKIYTSILSYQLSSDHFTLHGFRSGAAVSLALEGASLHEIMDHVGGEVVKRLYTTSSLNKL